MQITENRSENKVELILEGRLDNNSAAVLSEQIENYLLSPVILKIVMDFSKVEYISSAGIRTLLYAQKILKDGRKMIIKKPSAFVTQVFEVTGADIFLNVED